VNRFRLIAVCLLAIAGVAAAGFSAYRLAEAQGQFSEQARLSALEAEQIRRTVLLFSEWVVPSGKTFSDFVNSRGVDPDTTFRIVQSTLPVYNLRMIRAGNRFAIGRSVLGEFRAIRYQIDPDRELWVSTRGPDFQAEIKDIPSVTEELSLGGEVRDNLFNAVTETGESPELALQLADIFGWDVDFNTDTRIGDTFRLVLEKKRYLNGQAPRYGRVLAAEYVNAGQTYQAVLFKDPNGHPAYYAPDGKSLKKAFLRSPLVFGGRISSHFSYSRFHPILKIRRPHLGIDYAAPTGTPVQTIGDGTVESAGYTNGGGGNAVRIRHTNGYETLYMHLSRILVRAGQRVAQGQRIGLVGRTGLATGPHLDFRILQNGSYRNFERLRLPPALPVAKRDLAEFERTRDTWLARLPDPTTFLAHASARTSGSRP